jgi:hypothetical protein
VPRTTLDAAVPCRYRGGKASVRFAALADGSSLNCDPSFVAEQPRFVACAGDRTTVGSDHNARTPIVIVGRQLYKSANGATRHVESSVGRGKPSMTVGLPPGYVAVAALGGDEANPAELSYLVKRPANRSLSPP